MLSDAGYYFPGTRSRIVHLLNLTLNYFFDIFPQSIKQISVYKFDVSLNVSENKNETTQATRLPANKQNSQHTWTGQFSQ